MDDEPKKTYPTPVSKMSKVPSWISLGFVLGALFVMALPRPGSKAPAPVPVKLVEPPPPKVAQPTKLTTIEAVFEQWGQHAVWANESTEVAYWNPGTEEFTEYYEVRRNGSALYFRSIPQLTRRVIAHGKPPPAECPLRFTETEEQYREWREHGRSERPVAPPPLPAPTVSRP